VPGRNLVDLRICNIDNVQDKVIGISLRHCEQLIPQVVWDLFGKVTQSNSRFCLSDHLEVLLDHVSMPADNGSEKKKGRSLRVPSAIKKNIFVNAAFFYLIYAIVIAMARVNGEPKYTSYRDVYLLDQSVGEHLKALNCKGLEELHQFQD